MSKNDAYNRYKDFYIICKETITELFNEFIFIVNMKRYEKSESL